MTYDCGKERVTFALDIAGAYPPEAGLAHYRCEFVLERGDRGRVTLRDSFEFREPDNRLKIYFMSATRPQIDGDSLLLPYTGGGVRMTYREPVAISVEELKISDERLFRVWGGCIYRAALEFTVGRTGELTFSFTAAE